MAVTKKGKFILGTHTYYWQAVISGVSGYGKTKQQAIAAAIRCRRGKTEQEITSYSDFMDQIIERKVEA